jgi:hypothetical protein
MKLSHALGFIAVFSCLAAGCAGTSASQLAGVGPMRGGAGAAAGVASAAGRDLASEHSGTSLAGSVGRDDYQINAAATFSDHEPQFAGPTPQVPIPHDGRQGQPTDW